MYIDIILDHISFSYFMIYNTLDLFLGYPQTVEVLHMRDQINVGLGVADSLMQKRLLMVCADKNKGNILSGLMRKVLQDATSRFDAADINKLHHLGFVDLSKFGRLAAPEINDICLWCHQLLSQNPEYSILLQNCVCVWVCFCCCGYVFVGLM